MDGFSLRDFNLWAPIQYKGWGDFQSLMSRVRPPELKGGDQKSRRPKPASVLPLNMQLRSPFCIIWSRPPSGPLLIGHAGGIAGVLVSAPAEAMMKADDGLGWARWGSRIWVTWVPSKLVLSFPLQVNYLQVSQVSNLPKQDLKNSKKIIQGLFFCIEYIEKSCPEWQKIKITKISVHK